MGVILRSDRSSKVVIVLKCKRCTRDLADASLLCFYEAHNGGVHLILKPEVLHEVLSAPTPILRLAPQSDAKRRRISDHEAQCNSCNQLVGMLAKIGLKNEELLCFSRDFCLLTQDGEALPGKWSILRDFLPFIDRRSPKDWEQATEISAIKTDRPIYKTRKPSLNDLARVRLCDLVQSRPRPYQIECFTVASLNNTIVYLPTGSGKTLVAAMLISFMHQLNPLKSILFIVDRVPLAFQQGQYILEQTGLSVIVVVGENVEDIPLKSLSRFAVIIMTAQVASNLLGKNFLRIEDVSLVILDEIHHAVKSHPYAIFLKTFIRPACDTEFSPLLLGLSASPINGKVVEMGLKLLELLDLTNSTIFMPCIYLHDLESTVNRPQMDYRIVENISELNVISQAIEEYCKMILALLKKKLGLTESSEIHRMMTIDVIRGTLRAIMDRIHITGNQAASELAFHFHHSISALEINSVIGPRYATRYLEELLPTARRIMPPEPVDKLQAVLSISDAVSGKVSSLLKVLSTIETDDHTRVLIFVQTKRTGRYLREILLEDKDIENKWKPEIFVGQAAGQLDGMSWIDKQAPLLKAFREGTTKLLISTSVLEEGMDVPVCNYVILFDRTWSMTSLIQARGRARAKQSQYVLICDAQEKNDYLELLKYESDMRIVIANYMAENRVLSKEATFMAIQLVNKAALLVPTTIESKDVLISPLVSLEIRVFYFSQEGFDPMRLHSLSSFPLCQLQIQQQNEDILGSGFVSIIRGNFPRHATMQVREVSRLIFDAQNELYLKGFVSCSFNRGLGGGQLALNAERLDMGALVTPFLFNAINSLNTLLKVVFDVSLKKLHVFYITSNQKIFRIDVKFSNIRNFIIISPNSKDETTMELFIPLKNPCTFFHAHADGNVEIKLSNIGNFEWYLATEREIAEFMKIDEQSCLRLCLLTSRLVKIQAFNVIQSLGNMGIHVLYGQVETQCNIDGLLCRNDFEIASTGLNDFEQSFGLLSLYSAGTHNLMHRIPRDLLTRILNLDESQRTLVLSKLTLDILHSSFIDANRLSLLIDGYLSSEEALPVVARALPPNTAVVRFVTVTPTRLIYTLPKAIMMNRILRSFDVQYFLRVNFRDEDLERLTSTKEGSTTKYMFKRINHLLHNGLQIGGRRYEFLALSSSQLRDHGCWFISPYHDQNGVLINGDFIRQWCGEFTAIRNVAKYVARLGHSFSASTEVIHVEKGQYSLIPDYEVETVVNGKSRKYTFSDGIGQISISMARIIAEKMGYTRVPTAFQIRYAGFKGVLAVNPYSQENDPPKVSFRPSMKKFTSNHTSLEILNYSMYIPCYLNRQVLLILSSLGVSDEAFIKLQDEMLAEMSKALLDPSASRDMLISRTRSLLPDLRNLSDGDFTDPFVRSLLLAIYKSQMVELLTRTRIFIPKGRILMGVIDETGELSEDEVFIQISPQSHDWDGLNEGLLTRGTDDLLLVTATVAVAKNPCLHPGDLRRLRAVRNSLLERYHYDCIVFPRQGRRPVTDMCSGSDLDGDLYFVTWDPALLPPNIHEPIDYESPPAKELERIELNDIIEFIVTFISNDQLGLIANAHLAHSDLRPKGVADELCIRLAYMFSMAVDFPKTGYTPVFPKEAQVTSWPDFMQKNELLTYLSKKVIGVMFRKVKGIYYFRTEAFQTAPRPEYLVEGYECFIDWARELYALYAEQLARNLKLYQVSSESQVFSDCLLENLQFGKEEARSTFNILLEKIKLICEEFRLRLLETSSKENREIMQRISACYHVTYTEPLSFSGITGPILSFPWIFINHQQKPIPSENKVNLDLEIGRQVVQEAQRIFKNDIEASLVERINFVNLLCRTSEKLSSLRIVGSLRSWLLCPRSDINLNIDVLNREAIETVSKFFTIQCDKKERLIYYGGKPFAFTITATDNQEGIAEALRQFFFANPAWLCTMAVLLKWARHLNFVRAEAKFKGQITATSFILLCLTVGGVVVTPKAAIADAFDLNVVSEAGLFDEFKLRLETEESSLAHQIGPLLLKILRDLAFSSKDHILALVEASPHYNHEYVNGNALETIQSLAFKAHHHLAQTLDINSLWNLTDPGSCNNDRPITRRKRLKIVRKYATSNTVFMENCLLVLFEGSSSPSDIISFSVYQLRARSYHLGIQCFSPFLREVSDDTSPQYLMQNDCSLYNEYFAHAYRQLDLARQSSEEGDLNCFGNFRYSIKFGNFYLTSLPKLFVEDANSATITKVREALSLGFSRVGEMMNESILRSKSSNFNFGLPSESLDDAKVSTDIKEVLKPSPALDTNNKTTDTGRLPIIIPVCRKKTTMSPMSSAFEPLILNDQPLQEFLLRAGFTMSDKKETFAVTLTLFNSSINLNSDFHVIYDANMAFVKMQYRPVRWMVCNVKTPPSTKNNEDYRIVLSSAKPVIIEECSDVLDCPANLVATIRSGMIEIDGHKLIVKPNCRALGRTLVRHTTSDIYRLVDTTAISHFISENSQLGSNCFEILEQMRVVITHVTEYSEFNPSTGEFLHLNEKMESEIHIPMSGADLSPEFAACLIPTFWQLAQIFKTVLHA